MFRKTALFPLFYSPAKGRDGQCPHCTRGRRPGAARACLHDPACKFRVGHWFRTDDGRIMTATVEEPDATVKPMPSYPDAAGRANRARRHSANSGIFPISLAGQRIARRAPVPPDPQQSLLSIDSPSRLFMVLAKIGLLLVCSASSLILQSLVAGQLSHYLAIAGVLAMTIGCCLVGMTSVSASQRRPDGRGAAV